jgi:hypothetical protein
MADFKPDVKLPAGASINTAHPDYKALEAIAREEGWTQKAFSRTLGLEVARSELARAAAPAPAPEPAPAPAVDYEKMTTSQKFHYALVNGKRSR